MCLKQRQDIKLYLKNLTGRKNLGEVCEWLEWYCLYLILNTNYLMCGFELSGSGCDQTLGCFADVNEPLVFVSSREYILSQSNCCSLKTNSAT
jgi:hypothetical protein